jgi:type IV pilus assembly protein PilA
MIQNRKGFTLIELLIVVVIIGILAAIAIPKFANTKNKAYVTAMKADLHNLTTAEESFFADSTHYADWSQLNAGVTRHTPSSGVSNPVIATGAGYWFATVTHSQLSGQSCGISYGTTNPTVAGTPDGEPICK